MHQHAGNPRLDTPLLRCALWALAALLTSSIACGGGMSYVTPAPKKPELRVKDTPAKATFRVSIDTEQGLDEIIAQRELKNAEVARLEAAQEARMASEAVQTTDARAAQLDQQALAAEASAKAAEDKAAAAQLAANKADARLKSNPANRVSVQKEEERPSTDFHITEDRAKEACPEVCSDGTWTRKHRTEGVDSWCTCSITVLEFPTTPERLAATAATDKATSVKAEAAQARKQANDARRAAAQARKRAADAATRVEALKLESPQQVADAQRALATRLGSQLSGRFESELTGRKLGFVVGSDSRQEDLAFTGTVRASGANGYVLDWKLTHTRSDVIVMRGASPFPSHNTDPFVVIKPALIEMLNSYERIDGEWAGNFGAGGMEKVADAPSSATDGSNTYAVVIGVESYRNELPSADFAENDAKAFANYLQVTFGVPNTNIKLLVGDRASRSDIANAIEGWLPKVAKARNGRVIVYFSGHGSPEVETGDAYLVPWDADLQYLATSGYPIKRLDDSLGKLKNQQVMVFLDACFSGAGSRSALLKGTRPLVPVKPQASRGAVRFAAAANTQITGAAPAGKHGLFTYHLLQAFSGKADANADRNITLAEITDYVTTRVKEDAQQAGREQTPSLSTPPGFDATRATLIQGLK